MSATRFASYLQSRLDALGLSKAEAARRSGISRQTWYRIAVADIDEVRLSTLVKLAKTLQVRPEELLLIYFQKEFGGTSHAAHHQGVTPSSLH
jgi:DNA-binding Xre family transcriptional regulator